MDDDPWSESDPWSTMKGPSTQPASFAPPTPVVNPSGYGFPPSQPAPGATLAPKQSQWQDAQGNRYFMSIQGDQVSIDSPVLQNGRYSGTLRGGTLEVQGLPGVHQYSENRIVLGPPMSSTWDRVDEGHGGNAAQWNGAQNGTQAAAPLNGHGHQPQQNSGWGQQQDYGQQQLNGSQAASLNGHGHQPQQNNGWGQQQDYGQQQLNGSSTAWDSSATGAQNSGWGGQENSQPAAAETAQAENVWGNYTATAQADPYPAPATDAWGGYTGSSSGQAAPATNDGWGGWGGGGAAAAADTQQNWEDAEKRRYENYWKDFNAAQEWYIQQGNPPGTNVTADPFQNCRETRGEGEDFFLYDSVSTLVTGTNAEQCSKLESFDDLYHRYGNQIPDALRQNMEKCNFKVPTPVQKYAIPIGLSGRDVMCCAQTGSGKTAAFLVPMLASMIKHHKAVGDLEKPFEGPCKPDTLILTPTRELCVQTYEDALRFCYNTPHKCYRVYGQQAAKTQLTELARGADLIVATVGRLYDFVRAGIINVEDVNCLVLDEADRMLDMGFQDHIQEIVQNSKMPSKEERQTMMFSATFPAAIQELAKDYMHDFLMIVVGKQGSPAVTVTQLVEKYEKAEKFDKLVAWIEEILKKDSNNRILVFTNSKNQAKCLDENLYNKNVCNSATIHGDLDQSKREQFLETFRAGTLDVMIATDVASRGLDISRVTHVINFDAPKEIALYVHRIGRTGRIGHRGTSITFITYEGGWCLDTDEFLTELPDVMQGAPNTEIPDWLTEMSNQKKEGSWNTYQPRDWNTRDIRENDSTFQGWEQTQDIKNQGSGNNWSDWQGTGGNTTSGNDSWGGGWS